MFLNWNNQYCQNDHTIQGNPQIQCNPYQYINGIFHRTGTKNFTVYIDIQKTKIMASGLITSWEIDGETVETVADFIFLGSKITADGNCNHEIKRHLLLGRKVMTNLDSILKSRGFFAL